MLGTGMYGIASRNFIFVSLWLVWFKHVYFPRNTACLRERIFNFCNDGVSGSELPLAVQLASCGSTEAPASPGCR